MSAGQKQSVSAAAEALFETKNVADIRKIEAQTRQEIEGKNQQLRQLVGDSYRDLIEGTDKIIDISTKCHNVLKNILSIQEGFGTLAVGVTGSAASQDGKDFVRKHQELHAVGSRVKLILDTPEVIYGCLDGQQHLEAARRLLHVLEVYTHLQAAYSTELATKFPLMRHQWPLVLKFREQIMDIATSALSTKAQLTSQEAADAVAAVAALQGLDSVAALQMFLECRKQWVQQHLQRACTASEQSTQEPGAVLAELAQQVQLCIAQVGEVFTADAPSNSQQHGSSNNTTSSLLQQMLQEDEASASELYFGSADAASENINSPEAVAWREKNSASCQQLAPLQRSQVEQACLEWLSHVAAACAEHGQTLLQQCGSAASLLDAEQSVLQALTEWTLAQAVPTAEATQGTDTQHDTQAMSDQIDLSRGSSAAVSRLGRSTSSGAALVAAAVLGRAGGAAGSPRALTGRPVNAWDAACELVLGHKLDLWEALFHAPFLQRCKEIIHDAIQDACQAVHEPLQAALQAAAQHEPEAAGQLQPGKWPSFMAQQDTPDSVVQLDRTYTFMGSCTSSGAWGTGPHALAYSMSGGLVSMMSLVPGAATGLPAEEESGFRGEVTKIKQLFDEHLHAALEAVLLLTASTADSSSSMPLTTAFSSMASLTRAGSIMPSMTRASSMMPSMTRASSVAVHGIPAAGTTPKQTAAAVACAAAGKARAAELQQHTQQQCVALVKQLAGQLQQQLQGLPKVQDSVQAAATIEQVLLLARLCNAIASNSTMLPALLGPPSTWLAACKAGPYAAAGGSTGTNSNPLPASLAQGVNALGPAAAALLRMHHPGLLGQGAGDTGSAAAAQLAAIQQQLHAVASDGYTQWASWVSGSLSAALLAVLKSDELLRSNTTPLSWVETRVAADGGDGAALLLDPLDVAIVGDMQFSLPGCPSPALLQMLSLACWETRRAGEHLISTDALQLLLWELHGAALSVVQQLTSTFACSSSSVGHFSSAASTGLDSPETAGISEKGVLQLLFDQRLLQDVLGGGKPIGAVAGAGSAVGGDATSAAASAVAERKKLVAAVEQQLQDLLDPIDWATYEPHLWTNVQRFYQRTSVLLGTLTQLHQPADASRAPAAAAAAAVDLNSLQLLPVAPRFHYLPVSTPVALHGGKQRAMSSALSSALSIGFAGVTCLPGGADAGVLAGQKAVASGLSGQLPLGANNSNSNASDLAAQCTIPELGGGAAGARGTAESAGRAAGGAAVGAAGSQLHLSADAAAAAGASALSAIQARLQGSSFGAFGSMLGDRAAEVTAMAQNFGDLLPSAGLGGGLLSSFSRRDGPPLGSKR